MPKANGKSKAREAGEAAGKELETTLSKVVHSQDRDVVRRAANDATEWSLSSGAEQGYNKRYMGNIAKGAKLIQQEKMRETADYAQENYAAQAARRAKTASKYKGAK